MFSYSPDEVRGFSKLLGQNVSGTIEAFAATNDRIYKPATRRQQLTQSADALGRNPAAVVETHVRWHKALRRAKIVTRLDADR